MGMLSELNFPAPGEETSLGRGSSPGTGDRRSLS